MESMESFCLAQTFPSLLFLRGKQTSVSPHLLWALYAMCNLCSLKSNPLALVA